jgi:Zn-dependent peptidase ImmA (M78 family)
VLATTASTSNTLSPIGSRESFPVSGLSAEHAEVEAIAGRVRQVWKLPWGPISNVVELLEHHGVIVLRSTLASSDVDAFSPPYEDRPIVVLSGDKNGRARSRFDAAHELGHLVMHGQEVWGLKQVEDQAHWFAGAFLMPAQDIELELPDSVIWEKFFALKRKWHVSLAALLMRAKYLKRINPNQYLAAIKTTSARGWRRVEPIPLGPCEEPQLIKQLVAVTDRSVATAHPVEIITGLVA